ncbi:fimbria/pilus outer membrane usher protein [Hyphomicrobium methylovorum]|uniref:fimbria/pilus outer membrane usher protein n=1 Tax=Hyphomicrobium methylovorum TaxID=84 RepID=UPI001AEEE562|nr:fimbria/pilus outer membrane usher protein [Hyphomicrobium methylovorum]
MTGSLRAAETTPNAARQAEGGHSVRAVRGQLATLFAAVGFLGVALLRTDPLLAGVAPQDGSEFVAQEHTLNSTGRAVTLAVPLTRAGDALGDISVVIGKNDSVLIPKQPLLALLEPVIDSAVHARLAALPGNSGRLSLIDINSTGVKLKFDRRRLELVLIPDADVHQTDVPITRAPKAAAPPLRPADFSGYVNVTAGVDYYWDDGVTGSGPGAHVNLQSAMRWHGSVIENEASLGGRGGDGLCPLGARCIYDDLNGFRRTRSRIVYDIPDDDIRIQAGDADVFTSGFQRAPDVAGFTIEKSPRKFHPGIDTSPGGRTRFQLDRTSEIDVRVNGVVVRHMRLAAGTYDLSNFPLPSGASDIELVITDNAGQTRSLHFSTFAGDTLLAPGMNEWSVSAGVPSYLFDSERRYESGAFFGTGFLRYGLTDALTGEVNLQGDQRVAMGGVGGSLGTPWGLFGLDGALSTSDTGFGFATQLKYDLTNFRGPFSYYSDLPESFRFNAEYRSRDFREPGEFLVGAGDILYPQFPYWLRLSAYYSMALSPVTSATLSARYQFANDDALILSPYTLKDDRYGADLTLSRPLTSWMSGSLTLGYSNESYAYRNFYEREEPEFRLMVRLSAIPAEHTRIETSYDTLNDAGYVFASRESGYGVGSWQTSINAQQDGSSDTSSFDGSITYIGNRSEVRVAQRAGFAASVFNGFEGGPRGSVTSIEAATSIAFADGVIGVGRPIRGNGFAILSPHESIADLTVVAGMPEDVSAEADWLGPAVVPNLPAYSRTTIPVDVPDLPVGYSLGSGTYEAVAPYKAGYRIQVGSAHSVSVYGKLLDAQGEPLALLTGAAHASEEPDRRVEIFTNSAGRFAADGLSPGRWIIDMGSDEDATHYSIDVPPGTIGLFKAGDLMPGGAT